MEWQINVLRAEPRTAGSVRDILEAIAKTTRKEARSLLDEEGRSLEVWQQRIVLFGKSRKTIMTKEISPNCDTLSSVSLTKLHRQEIRLRVIF